MKLRLTNNHIRFRVRKSDLAALVSKGVITESITLPDGTEFSFVLSMVPNINSLAPSMRDNTLQIGIPINEGNQWAETDLVGLETDFELEDGSTLVVLIEKDFPCEHRPTENKADTFIELAKKERED